MEPETLGRLPAAVRSELGKLDQSIPLHFETRHLHQTWAQTFFSRPELYFQPRSVSEIQKTVTLARRCRRRLCVVGFGHSPSDLTCTSSWMLNLDKLNSVLEFDEKTGVVRFEAGISLHDLNAFLATKSFSLPNLGSIDVQSLAGAISTGTHGSSLQHGLLSQSITGISLILANGHLVRCSSTNNPELFRAALLSLGSLGIIVEITFQPVPLFKISWTQSLHTLPATLSLWSSSLWVTAEYTRVWWLPYMERAVIWRGARVPDSTALQAARSSWYGGRLGYYMYHNLLYLSHYFPRMLPWVEWFVFGMQYGFKPGAVETTAVEYGKDGLLMDCLYSQFVNEWAIPLSKGPEAISRLGLWIQGREEESGIPFSSKGIWVHCPIEVRVTDSNTESNKSGVRPYLDPTCADGPTLYLNATLYRPYGKDPPCVSRYYEAFEWLMREMGGRPHWAKNFKFTDREYIEEAYGKDMDEFMRVRDENDPEQMFVGEWHQTNLGIGQLGSRSMAEGETGRKRAGIGDGVEWRGERVMKGDAGEESGNEGEREVRGSPTATTTSEESFDYMAKGEASVYGAGGTGEV